MRLVIGCRPSFPRGAGRARAKERHRASLAVARATPLRRVRGHELGHARRSAARDGSEDGAAGLRPGLAHSRRDGRRLGSRAGPEGVAPAQGKETGHADDDD